MKQAFFTVLFIFILFSCDEHECMQLESNLMEHQIVGSWDCRKIVHKGDIIEGVRYSMDVCNNGEMSLNMGGGMGSILGGVGSINENTVTVQHVRHNPHDGKDYIDLILVFDILKITKSELIIKLIDYPSDANIGDIWYFTRINKEYI